MDQGKCTAKAARAARFQVNGTRSEAPGSDLLGQQPHLPAGNHDPGLSDRSGQRPVTVNIFLRELRPFWREADPDPLPVLRAMGRRLNLDLARYDYDRKSRRA